MQYIYVGKIVNTHGLKGEVRILSSFDYKKDIFKEGFPLYIGEDHIKLKVQTYRRHKEYDMVLFEGIKNIEDVIKYKGKLVYIEKESIQKEGYFIEELLSLKVYEKEKYIGKIEEIEESKAHKILLLDTGMRIPYLPVFVKKIEIEKQKMEVELIGGFDYEN